MIVVITEASWCLPRYLRIESRRGCGCSSGNAASAYFYILNERTQNGVITVAGADGSYTAPAIDGVLNDHVRIAYETPSGSQSDSLCLLLTTDVSPDGSAPACPP